MSELAPTRPGRLWSGADGKFNLEAALFAISGMSGHYGTPRQSHVEQQLRAVRDNAAAEPAYWAGAVTALKAADPRKTSGIDAVTLGTVIATAEHGMRLNGSAPKAVAALTA